MRWHRCVADVILPCWVSLHRVARQWVPSIFNKIIQRGSTARFLRSLRCPEKRHSYQLRDPCKSIVTRQFNRLVFGLIDTYNLLPQNVIDAPIEFPQRFFQRVLIETVHKERKPYEQEFGPRWGSAH